MLRTNKTLRELDFLGQLEGQWFWPLEHDMQVPGPFVISGHTHQIVNELKGGKLFLNPGECCGWVTDRCTVAVLDLDTMSAQIVDVHD